MPRGKALFFPLVNAFNVNTPSVEPPKTAQEAWEELEGLFGPISELHASIDGVAVANLDPATTPYRACAGPVSRCGAPPFSMFLPAENIFGNPGITEGTYEPAVADGFYLRAGPLTPGAHTITFGGEGLYGGGPFVQNTTYNLVVSK